jgi:carbon monoxide dehydrogenase subunit G
MRHVERSADLPVDPERAFAFLADLANLPRWQSGVTRAELLTDGPIAVGSTARVATQVMGQDIQADLRVTELDPPRRLVLATEVAGMKVDAILTLEPRDGGSRATFGMDVAGGGLFGGAMEGMVAGAAEGELDTSLTRLREALSERPPPS